MKILLRRTLLGLVLMLVVGAGAATFYFYAPVESDLQALPSEMAAVDSMDGRQFMATSMHRDYDYLRSNFMPQSRRSYCGIATMLTLFSAANAAGMHVRSMNEEEIFESIAHVKSKLNITMAGMALSELAAMLQETGADVRVVYANESSVERFREDLRKAMQDDGEFLVVNYSRAALGQVGYGHISPIGGYDVARDKILVVDVAAHKYPHTWVDVEDMFQAMNTVGGNSFRGYVLAGFDDV